MFTHSLLLIGFIYQILARTAKQRGNLQNHLRVKYLLTPAVSYAIRAAFYWQPLFTHNILILLSVFSKFSCVLFTKRNFCHTPDWCNLIWELSQHKLFFFLMWQLRFIYYNIILLSCQYADLQPLRACVMYNTEARISVWTSGYHTVCPTDSLFDFCGQRDKRTCTFCSAKHSIDFC